MDKDKFRELLENRKKEILNEIENQKKFFPHQAGPGDMLDETMDSSCRDEYFRARDSETEILHQIDEALGKIESGIYGICEDCGEEISGSRLVAMPFACLCAECKRKEEER